MKNMEMILYQRKEKSSETISMKNRASVVLILAFG